VNWVGCTVWMASVGSVVAKGVPMDLTEELPLVGENELPPARLRGHRRRNLLIAAAVVILLGGATGLILWLTGSAPATGLVVTTETVKVTTGTIKQTVAASGTIEPASQASLDFAVSGTVTAVDVKAGQVVTSGETLASVGTSALQSDVDAASAQLTAAQARQTSDASSNAAATQIDSDEAAVTSAESALTTAQTNLADASLTSTISGTVASVSLVVGQQVTGSGGSGTGGTGNGGSDAAAATGTGTGSSTSQIVVIGTNSYLVNTTVDDTQIGQIADGDQATLIPTGSTTTDYGTVASIGLIATQSSDVATFPVVIDVTGDPAGLFAGSTADIAIIVKQLNNVVEVPTAAITYTSSGQAEVTQVVGGKDVSRSVDVGEAALGETQITSGVKSGDRILERVITFKAGSGRGTGGAGLFGGTGTGGLGGAGSFRTGGFGGGGGTFIGGG